MVRRKEVGEVFHEEVINARIPMLFLPFKDISRDFSVFFCVYVFFFLYFNYFRLVWSRFVSTRGEGREGNERKSEEVFISPATFLSANLGTSKRDSKLAVASPGLIAAAARVVGSGGAGSGEQRARAVV